jgi:hypothetical protein
MAIPPAETITELAGRITTGAWAGEVGSAYVGVVLGLANDAMIEGAATALGAGLLYPVGEGKPENFDQPIEAIDLLGRDAMLLRYPGEDHYTSLRPRVRDKWNFWQSGIKTALESELASAGFTGAEVFVPNDFTPRPAPATYWSRFWILFPLGSSIVPDAGGFIVGVDSVGPGFRLGPTDLRTADGAAYLGQLKSVIARMKPAQWVCWDIVFEYAAGNYVHIQVKKRTAADTEYSYADSTFPN